MDFLVNLPFRKSCCIAGISITVLVNIISLTDGRLPNNGFASLTQSYLRPRYVV